MSKTPNKPVGRALADEAEMDEDMLDGIVGGAGIQTGRQDEHDGWSKVVDDHAKEIPASAPAGRKSGSKGGPDGSDRT